MTSPATAPALRVSEIFHSLQGESTRVGLPTVFIRLTGCPLRCTYCDTTYAYQGGTTLPLTGIMEQVAAQRAHYVTVTGGEPLAQQNCLLLLKLLCDAGYSVSLETGGALDIGGVDARVSRILDIKTPGSGEAENNYRQNLEVLTAHDEIKIVLCDETDYLWARAILFEKKLAEKCPVSFSAAHGNLEPAQLADWILRDRLPVRLQVQLHKILWGNERAR
ncbi:MAG: 7-carboxy-7-deazaguanine synthase QueE [Sulfuricellaceae bacterium]